MIKVNGNIIEASGYTVVTGGQIYSKKTLCYELGAVLARADAEGIPTPDLREKLILNDFLRHEKRSGVFQKLDLYFLFAYNNLDICELGKINWKNPFGTMASFMPGVLYTEYGIEGDGIEGYVATNYNPTNKNAKYVYTDACRGAVIYKEAPSMPIDGLAGSSTANFMQNSSAAGQRINSNVSTTDGPIDLTGTGLKLIQRTSLTEVNSVNKSVQTFRLQNAAALYNEAQVLFRRGTIYGDVGLSEYFMGASLTYSQSQAHRANLNNLFAKFGLEPIA